MGVRFIYGRAGMGKTHYCFQKINDYVKNKENKKLIYIVPEQYTFQRETLLLKTVGEAALMKCEVLSFKRMAHRVFEACGGRAKDRMNEAGRCMLLQRIFIEYQDELRYFNKVIKEKGFIKIISEIITEFKKYNINLELINNNIEKIEDTELKDKLYDLSFLFDKFNENIEKNLIDADDELTLLAQKLSVCDLYDGSEIWIDEFTTFTPQQLDVIRMLLKKAENVNITLCMDELGNGNDTEMTDIFNVIKNTESRVLKIAEEENIKYNKPINLNNNVKSRFDESEELAHIEKYLFSYPLKIYDKEVNDIKLYKANNSYDEIENVAKEIYKLVREKNYRYKDISVVCRNIDTYEKVITVIFNEYDIPYFLDKKINMLNNPLVVLILSVFEIYLKNWSYESVFKYLKSGLVNIPRNEVDILENYVLANGIKNYKWTMDLEKTEEETEEINPIDIMLKVREPLMNFHKDISGKKTVRDICTALYNFLVESDVLNAVENKVNYFEEIKLESKVKEYSQVINIVFEVLEQAVDVLGEEVIDVKEFYKILNSGFESKEIGVIPIALDQVNVGDIARIKGRDVKALFIVGVNDGVLPASGQTEGILTDNDRDKLKDTGIQLAATTKAKVFEERFMAYTAFTISRKYLYISYPMADFEGKSLRPSILIPTLKSNFKKLQEESSIYSLNKDKYSKITAPIPTFNELILTLRKYYEGEAVEPYWKQVYKYFLDNGNFNYKTGRIFEGLEYENNNIIVSREKIKQLYLNDKGKINFSVSRLENYAGCPFSYFVKYGLKAKDRKIYEFTAPDLGSFMHEILEGFSNRVISNNLAWSELDRDKCNEIINELVDNKLKENPNSILNSNKKYKYFSDRFKKILTNSVSVLSKQMSLGEFKILKNEFEFGENKYGAPIKITIPDSKDEILLNGKIDRIDSATINDKTYVRIIDYKSGNKDFDINELYYGIQLQLIVYLDAIIKDSEHILKTQAIPGAILYFKIDDPIIESKVAVEVEKVKEELMKELKMRGLVLKDPNLVRAMDNGINDVSLVIPAAFKKNCDEFTSASSVVTEEQFTLLRKFVNQKMVELCSGMLSGKIKIEPCKSKNYSYCTYCQYSSICQFDTKIPSNKYKVIGSKSTDEVWEKIKRSVEESNE